MRGYVSLKQFVVKSYLNFERDVKFQVPFSTIARHYGIMARFVAEAKRSEGRKGGESMKGRKKGCQIV